MFFFLLLLLPAFVWDTVTLSDRLAGPMHRLRSAIRDVAAGKDIEPIKFRDGDFWQDVAGDFNMLLERISRKLEKEAEHATEQGDTEAVAVCEEVCSI